jgi:hypothetical protein
MLRIVLGSGVAQLEDRSRGTFLAEPAAVAIDRRTGRPGHAGWRALTGDVVCWPFEALDLAHLDPDPEPRRCLLRHLLRTALAERHWWERMLRPTVVLVVTDPLPRAAIRTLRSDAVHAGAARNVRLGLLIAPASSPAIQQI